MLMTVIVRRLAQAVSAYALLAVVALSLTLCRSAFSEWITLRGVSSDPALLAGFGDSGGGTEPV